MYDIDLSSLWVIMLLAGIGLAAIILGGVALAWWMITHLVITVV